MIIYENLARAEDARKARKKSKILIKIKQDIDEDIKPKVRMKRTGTRK